jgi:hypothetical protein
MLSTNNAALMIFNFMHHKRGDYHTGPDENETDKIKEIKIK